MTTTFDRVDIWDKAYDFTNTDEWKCYLGRTTYDPKAEGGAIHLHKDWYRHKDNEDDPDDFFKTKKIWTEDPTQGFVNYTRACMNINKCIVDTPGGVEFRAITTDPANEDWYTKDNHNFYLAAPRIESTKYYNGGVFIIDVNKLPTACGTWPAFWLVGTPENWSENRSFFKIDWPRYGEIDIIEQINGMKKNHTTLHTLPGCDATRKAYGAAFTDKYDDCACCPDAQNPAGNGFTGCAIDMEEDSAGAAVDGYYVCEWELDKYMRFWYFERSKAPSGLQLAARKTGGKDTLDLTILGDPHTEHILGSGCNDMFKNMHLIINTTFCGAWAGAVPGPCKQHWSKPAECNTYLINQLKSKDKGKDLGEDYKWSVNSVAVFQKPKTTTETSTTPTSTESSPPSGPRGTPAASGTPPPPAASPPASPPPEEPKQNNMTLYLLVAIFFFGIIAAMVTRSR